MAQSKTASKLEAKALAASSKSEGMRMLLDAGYTVTRVKDVFKAPYGFVYGVAKRHGVVETAANRKAPAKAKTAKAKPVARVAKATKASVRVVKVAARPIKAKASARPADTTSAASRVAAKLAAKQPGRPSATRRQANRKPRATSVTKS